MALHHANQQRRANGSRKEPKRTDIDKDTFLEVHMRISKCLPFANYDYCACYYLALVDWECLMKRVQRRVFARDSDELRATRENKVVDASALAQSQKPDAGGSKLLIAATFAEAKQQALHARHASSGTEDDGFPTSAPSPLRAKEPILMADDLRKSVDAEVAELWRRHCFVDPHFTHASALDQEHFHEWLFDLCDLCVLSIDPSPMLSFLDALFVAITHGVSREYELRGLASVPTLTMRLFNDALPGRPRGAIAPPPSDDLLLSFRFRPTLLEAERFVVLKWLLVADFAHADPLDPAALREREPALGQGTSPAEPFALPPAANAVSLLLSSYFEELFVLTPPPPRPQPFQPPDTSGLDATATRKAIGAAMARALGQEQDEELSLATQRALASELTRLRAAGNSVAFAAGEKPGGTFRGEEKLHAQKLSRRKFFRGLWAGDLSAFDTSSSDSLRPISSAGSDAGQRPNRLLRVPPKRARSPSRTPTPIPAEVPEPALTHPVLLHSEQPSELPPDEPRPPPRVLKPGLRDDNANFANFLVDLARDSPESPLPPALPALPALSAPAEIADRASISYDSAGGTRTSANDSILSASSEGVKSAHGEAHSDSDFILTSREDELSTQRRGNEKVGIYVREPVSRLREALKACKEHIHLSGEAPRTAGAHGGEHRGRQYE